MAYTDGDDPRAFFGDLYELTIPEAAEKLYAGLWKDDGVSIASIQAALIGAVNDKELKPVRGSLRQIGNLPLQEPILNAFEIAEWAEAHGLELYSKGEWARYIGDEGELEMALEEHLELLRARQKIDIDDVPYSIESDPARLMDHVIRLTEENLRLKLQDTPSEPSAKSLEYLLMILITMAADRYRYRPGGKKSDVPLEIEKAAARLKLPIKRRKISDWLKRAATLVNIDR